MSDNALRRLAWGLALAAIGISLVSAVWLFSAAVPERFNWLESQVRGIVDIGAPILGLIIIRQQPRHRVGWLWLVMGVLVSVRILGHAIYYGSGGQAAGYSSLAYFILWSTGAANLLSLVGQALLLLWFPDGKLVSHRWRLLYLSLFIGFGILFSSQFMSGPNWNGGETAAGIIIDNPYGWIPEERFPNIGFTAFLTIVLSTVLAAVSLIFRYRSAERLVRYQIRWFVLGGILYVILSFVPVLFFAQAVSTNLSRLLFGLAFANSLPLYFAVGLAMLRYRLYDIDIIIRRTMQYATVSAVLVTTYYSSVILLQAIFTNTLNEQSPLVIVVSTLITAALFNPLRTRLQTFIDRRFYRRKYDAEQILAQFAQTARDEVELEKLTAELVNVVQETMQPEKLSIWLKQVNSEW